MWYENSGFVLKILESCLPFCKIKYHICLFLQILNKRFLLYRFSIVLFFFSFDLLASSVPYYSAHYIPE